MEEISCLDINTRILVVDDDQRVIDSYLEILASDPALEQIEQMQHELGVRIPESHGDDSLLDSFEVDSATQGEQALELALQAVEEDRPYAVAFIDIRMPPGWDGLETARRIREADEDIYIIFVTAYSDHTIDEMQRAVLKNTLYVSKPFHQEMIKQMARTFCMVWSNERDLIVSRDRIQDYSKQMAHQARHDGLTGLYNRGFLDNQLDIEARRSRRIHNPLGILMIDIDWFKLYNDDLGHVAGDDALRQIAQCIAGAAKRPGDFTARFGGEEFCVVLPNTNRDGIITVAEIIRSAVEAMQIEFSNDLDIPCLTVSIGGISRIPRSTDSGVSMTEEADQLLYEAKSSGKNRVVIGENF